MPAIPQLNVERDEDSILFDPDAIAADVPYRFSFLGRDMNAVKSEEGDVDFFYYQRADDESNDKRQRFSGVVLWRRIVFASESLYCLYCCALIRRAYD